VIRSCRILTGRALAEKLTALSRKRPPCLLRLKALPLLAYARHVTATIDPTLLEIALHKRLPEAQVRAAGPQFAVEGVQPALVVTATSAHDVASTLAIAREQGAAVVAWGGGSQMAYGMPPQRHDIALDMRKLNAVIEYEPADLTVTVEAGMRLADLQRLLAEQGQWLPLDPPLAGEATIGGVLATNASGPARHACGTLRDLLIGIRVATPEGELVKAGGRVVKNVAGYDLGKLHIGALGTLGVIVQAGFKIAPLPERITILAATGKLEAVSELALRLDEARLATQALVLTGAASSPDWTLLARFAGGAAAVERSKRDFALLTSTAGASMSEEAANALWTESLAGLRALIVARAGVLPTQGAEIAQAFAAAGASVLSYPIAGIVYASWPASVAPRALESLRQRCVDAGGALVLEQAPLDLKRSLDVWGQPRGDFSLMQRLKQEMDPQRVLSPGRYLGGI
jgi:glycolate oxidase FAD binding subunit